MENPRHPSSEKAFPKVRCRARGIGSPKKEKRKRIRDRLSDVSAAEINALLRLDFVLFTHKQCALARVGIRSFRSPNWTVPDANDIDFTLLPNISMVRARHSVRKTEGLGGWAIGAHVDGTGGRGRPWNCRALYERPTTLALLPNVGGKDVLDAGCGPGWYADWLDRQGARVVAVDSSRSMVELAGRRLGGRALILDEAFDLVLSSLVLHYLDDLSSVFAEWVRILKRSVQLLDTVLVE